jgi:hypothetical protein
MRLKIIAALAVAAIGMAWFSGEPAQSQSSAAVCGDQWEACLDARDAAAERCEASCGSYDNPNWDTCFRQCSATSRATKAQCDAQSKACRSGGSAAVATPRQPSQAQGNGCYLGECPEPGTIPSTQPTQPTTQPTTQPYVPPPPPITQQASWICQGPQAWCQMGAAGPVGMGCWCNVPVYGYFNGVIVPQTR